jgi:hypothetical protein
MYKLIGIGLLLLQLAACRKNNDSALVETAVQKKIEFHIHASQPYDDAFYNTVTADVQLEIYKINYLNGQNQLLWDTAYAARPVANYPHLPQKFLVEKSFPVLESSEKLQAKYTIRYQSPGGTNRQMAAEELIPGVKFVFLDVVI